MDHIGKGGRRIASPSQENGREGGRRHQNRGGNGHRSLSCGIHSAYREGVGLPLGQVTKAIGETLCHNGRLGHTVQRGRDTIGGGLCNGIPGDDDGSEGVADTCDGAREGACIDGGICDLTRASRAHGNTLITPSEFGHRTCSDGIQNGTVFDVETGGLLDRSGIKRTRDGELSPPFGQLGGIVDAVGHLYWVGTFCPHTPLPWSGCDNPFP